MIISSLDLLFAVVKTKTQTSYEKIQISNIFLFQMAKKSHFQMDIFCHNRKNILLLKKDNTEKNSVLTVVSLAKNNESKLQCFDFVFFLG